MVQNQGVAKLSGITSGDSIEATGGCQGHQCAARSPHAPCTARFSRVDVCAAQHSWVERLVHYGKVSWRTISPKPNRARWMLGLSSEVVNATVHSTVKSADFFQTSTKCSKLVIDAIPSGSDNSAGNYRPAQRSGQ